MLRTSLAMVLTAVTTSAWAHQDSTFHSHPHLLISNEFLAGLLLMAAAGLGYLARRILLNRERRRKERRPQAGWMPK